MKVTKIIIHKCNRFYNKGKDTIEINPRDKINLILGRNGSGKSSLLEVGFNVLPPNSSDFRKGGFRKQWIESDAGSYILISDFKSTPSHEFWFNGVNLNVGFTAGVQLDLVKDHFGITKDIMNLLIGNDNHRFTAMSPAARGEWFARMSNADFTFAFKLFGSLRKTTRDTKANATYQLNRLVKESEKLIEPTDLQRLKDRSTRISNELTAVSRLSKNNVSKESMGRLQRHLEFFSKDISELLAIGRIDTAVNATSLDESISNREAITADIVRLRTISSEIGTRLVEYEEELKRLEDIGGIDLDVLLGEISLVTDEINGLTDDLKKYTFDLPSNVDVHRTESSVMAFLNELRQTDGFATDDVVGNLAHTLRVMETRLNELLKDKEMQLWIEKEYNDVSNVTCPACTTSFNPKCTHVDIESVRSKLSELDTSIAEMRSKIKVIHDEYSIRVIENKQLGKVRSTMSWSTSLAPLWVCMNNIIDKSFVNGIASSDYIPECIELANDFLDSVRIKSRLNELGDYLKPLLVTKERVLSNAGKDVTIHDELNKTTSRLHLVNEELSEKGHLLNKLRRNEETYKRIMSLYEEAVSIEQDVLKCVTDIVEVIHQEEIDLLVDGHTRELTTVNNAIYSGETTQNLVNDIRNEADTLVDEGRILEMILAELNPKDGLIADQMYLHIRKIINLLNGIIARVWSYPMVVRDCSNDNGELNYKFPVYLHVDTNERDDVSSTSKSQKNIINTAFRIVAYNALGLRGAPLFLDEFDEGFDEEHRANMLMMLDQLFSEGDFGQILIISHFFETYDGFSNKDYIVIDGDGMNIKGEITDNVRVY